MKIRIRFEKEGAVRYIGHLDVMRYFHKALQRAHIDVSFSAGFHPHPIMSFASPLGVGLTSRGEYVDIEIGKEESSQEMIRRLNEVMVEGIRVTGICRLEEEGRKNNAMALVEMAEYLVRIKEEAGRNFFSDSNETEKYNWDESVQAFLNQSQIHILKKTKKSEKEVDIRPLILVMKWDEKEKGFCMRLTAGSMNNLKPELVMDTFFHFIDLPLEGSRKTLEICRLDMLTKDGISLGSMGEEIQ
ncbi:MAG: TIGR03936 family radical SAM-associated protein [Clostridiales bacterium]|nr:TIGR03936 family radical SAM-associated protein [Clostridiales bacterium]